MTECSLCERDGADPVSGTHDACHAECERRRKDGVCVHCGDRPIIDADIWQDAERCGSCSGDTPCMGYPGGIP